MNVRAAVLTCLILAAGLAFLLLAPTGPTPALAVDPPRPTPTVAPGGPPAEQMGTSALPDLVVESIRVSPEPVLVTRQVQIEITIANHGGDLADGNNFYVDLYLDLANPPEPRQPGLVTWGIQSFYLPANGRYTLTYTTVFTNTGTHTLYAQVDTDGYVVESNEANNVSSSHFFEVTTSNRFWVDSHRDFQSGFSNLDLSSPEGALQSGTRWFREPDDQPALYNPDFRVNPTNYTPLTGTVPIADRTNQIRPQLATGVGDVIFAVWEDGRNGAIYNRDIYFARSADRGVNWSEPIRVNQDPPDAIANQTFPTIVYDATRDRLYVFWQDNRRGNYDIWMAFSADGGVTWHEPPNMPVNNFDVDPNADQVRPTAVVNKVGNLYVAWQDRRNRNDDIYFAFSTDAGQTFSENVFVTDDPRITQQSQSAPAIAVKDDTAFITWQDARNVTVGDPADIYYTVGQLSNDPDLPPYTFEIDRRANEDGTIAPQYTPVIATYPITQVVEHDVTYEIPVSGTIDVKCQATFVGQTVHIAWEDWRNDNPDIFYGWAFSPFTALPEVRLSPLPPGVPDTDVCNDPENRLVPPVKNYAIEKNENISQGHTAAVDARCLAPNAPPPRPTEPSAQWQPAIAVNSEFGPYIVWSDGRNYDDANFDIYMAMPRREKQESLNFTDIVSLATVNDNIHRQAFLEDMNLYLENEPAAAWQAHPAVAATSSGVYVVWDDNRNEDPFLGYPNNRDIFVAEYLSSPAKAGVYVSPVFDAGAVVTWYGIQWWGITDLQADLTLQTRIGSTPNAPRANVAGNTWSQWAGVGGTGGRYDAPGQNIRSPSGALFPRSRYIQFRVNLNVPAGRGGTCISEITLQYEVPKVYLPLMLKGAGAAPIARQPNDPYFLPYQWNLNQIAAPQAWAYSLGAGKTVAVIDTGIDLDHPEFAGQVLSGRDFVNADTTPEDQNGHGTHVAGIAAARTDNGVGVAGVAWDARVRPVKVLDASGNGTTANVASAIRWSVDQGDRIINLSLGGTADSSTLRDAVNYAYGKGALIVAAAGNSALEGNPTFYPAAYDHVLAVAAVRDTSEHARYSETGPYIDIAAPGGDPDGETDPAASHWIWSTYPRNKGFGLPAIGYMAVAGTSQAAPHVSGVAVLVWALNPGLSADQVASVLQESATDLGRPGRDDVFGNGLVNAAGALSRARSLVAAASAVTRPVASAGGAVPLTLRPRFVPGQLIVAFQPEVDSKSARSVWSQRDLTVDRQIAADVYLVAAPLGEELRLARELVDDPRVRYAEPNYLVTGQ
ncbi:MAG: S8 family serine peptidase [Ardenticatenaceae bacterium]|nr:S8 family serine peptidase [Ardenticatenaceae bacterium]